MSARIERGTPIAVVAPSHAYNVERFEAGLAIARQRGHDLRPLPDMLQPHRYFAAPDAHRLDQLVEALSSDEYGAVWVVRGGSGLTRLLRDVPFDELPPRPVIGFSDTTALLVPLAQRTRSPVVHGPVLHSLANTEPRWVDHLFDLLEGKPVGPLRGRQLCAGEANGRLVGGNLCMLAAMCGTAFQVDTRGAILVLEEVGEQPYRVDRMLVQLRDAGLFDRVAGIALGEFSDCGRDASVLDAIFTEIMGDLGVPVLADLPIGHGPHNAAFPLGVGAQIANATLSWPS